MILRATFHTISIALLLVSSLFLLSTPVIAQVDIPDVPSDFSLQLTPEIPGPVSSVSAKVQSNGENLARAYMRWSLNGTVISEGAGVVSTSFVVGPIGSTNTLRVSATLQNGRSLNVSTTIRPAGVDLLWQSRVYTPPFYPGKASVPYDAAITFSAMPFFVGADGSRFSAANLTYTWRINDTVIGDLSGRGKQTVTLQGPKVYRGVTVGVEVASSDGSIRANRSVSFNGEQPFILFYENDPLLGIRFDHAMPQNVNLTRTEATISAFPYFFSTEARGGGALQYTWTLNDSSAAPSPKNSADLILRQTAKVAGFANIGLAIQNLSQIFQAANKNLQVNFGPK